jgi:hypothetical protein
MNEKNTAGFTVVALCMAQCYFVGYKQPEILKAQIYFRGKI